MNTRANPQVKSVGKPRGRHAVVLGGSLAGPLAARVLSDHFENVTLIERDAFTNTCETRRGIPQANHVHGLLVRGRQILEELFPGLQDEMIAAGAPLVDMAYALGGGAQSSTASVQHAGAAVGAFYPWVLFRLLGQLIKPKRVPQPHAAPKQVKQTGFSLKPRLETEREV